MKSIARIFLTGILTILPILATIYLALWLFTAMERFLGKQLLYLLPDEYYRTGMGLLLAVLVIFSDCFRTIRTAKRCRSYRCGFRAPTCDSSDS